MIETITFIEPRDADTKLAMLHLNRRVLIDALVQANMYCARLTLHHPRLYRYGVMTGEAVAALRDILVPRGWEKRDEGHYELVFNPLLNLSIAVASGDEGTGDPQKTPSNRSEKGPRTAKAVKDNQTADLFPETLSTVPNSMVVINTWILLHRVCDNEIRLELSRPNAFDDTERFVTGWSERILLGAISLDNNAAPLPMPQLSEEDIVISRKAA